MSACRSGGNLVQSLGGRKKFFPPPPQIEKFLGTARSSLYLGTKCWLNGNLLEMYLNQWLSHYVFLEKHKMVATAIFYILYVK